MKILTIGLFTFIAWSALSTFIYVCKIKGLCYEPETIQITAVGHNNITVSDTLQRTQVPKQTVIPENLTIYFAFDKSEFNANAASDKYYDASNAYMAQNAQARLNITGYTDVIGTDEYNMALGYRRAQRMQLYFESKGIQANKIIVTSKGEKEPADSNNTASGRANNRRTVVKILSTKY